MRAAPPEPGEELRRRREAAEAEDAVWPLRNSFVDLIVLPVWILSIGDGCQVRGGRPAVECLRCARGATSSEEAGPVSVDAFARTVWDYHRLNHPLQPADCIIVLGSHDTR